MLNRFFAAIRRMFGGDGNAPHIEDAADLGALNQRFLPEDTQNPNHPLATRTRSLSEPTAEEVIDFSGNHGIVVHQPRFLWCLDNGHGSEQPGKRSPKFEDGTQFEEWEFNRDIVRRIADKLDEIGVQNFIVVPEDQVGSFLKERVSRANQQPSPLGLPKIFLSVHSNAAGSNEWRSDARGLEVWHYPNSDSGKPLASTFHRKLLAYLPTWEDRGIKSHTSGSSKIFYVLANTSMPAVLTESGFYTHPEEAKLLMQEETRHTIAMAHVAAILKIEQEGYEGQEIYPKAIQVADS